VGWLEILKFENAHCTLLIFVDTPFAQ